MSSKHRPSTPKAGPRAPGTAVPPELRARQAQDAGRHREAIELYKELLKRERRPDWVDGLAESYAGRAGELAAKGMLPEALVVWRNRASLCGKPLAEGPYLDWLLRAGEHEAALRLLATAGGSPADLETRLAAVALTASDSVLAQIPADNPLRCHRASALAAIAACGRGDEGALAEHLRAIPFRSPYRDLRFILKALSVFGGDAAQASALIERVAVDGPFERLAASVRSALLPGSRWLAAMLDLDDEGRQLLLDLKGCPDNRRALLLELAELTRGGAQPAPARVVDLLLRRSRSLPATAAGLCRRLLPYAVQRVDEYVQAFGPLATGERECIHALAKEIHARQRWDWEQHWLRAVALLAPPEQAPLRAALILRHLFDMVAGHKPGNQGSPCDPQCIGWLKRSLELDPDDRATHLKLIRILRQGQDLKAARAQVDAALARFPDDPLVLLEAVETALAGDAFKKAVTLAKRLLQFDPINSKVRTLIGQAHISHARKQIRSRRPDAAGRELDAAVEWLTAASERSIAKLLRGLASTDAEATAVLREAAGELGGKLVAAWHLLLESVRIGSKAPESLRRAGIDLAAKNIYGTAEVLTVMHALNALPESEHKALATVLDTLRAPLKRAAALEFSESERISICETLLRRKQQVLLLAYAETGLQRWPERPVFAYFTIHARYGDNAHFAMTMREGQMLEKALDKALADGDQRTVLRLRELMGAPGFDADEDDEDDDSADWKDFDPIAEMLENPRAALDKAIAQGAEDEVIAMARSFVPHSEFRKMERAAAGNHKKLAEMVADLIGEMVQGFTAGKPAAAKPAAAKPAAAKPAPPGPASAAADGKGKPAADDRQKGLFDD